MKFFNKIYYITGINWPLDPRHSRHTAVFVKNDYVNPVRKQVNVNRYTTEKKKKSSKKEDYKLYLCQKKKLHKIITIL